MHLYSGSVFVLAASEASDSPSGPHIWQPMPRVCICAASESEELRARGELPGDLWPAGRKHLAVFAAVGVGEEAEQLCVCVTLLKCMSHMSTAATMANGTDLRAGGLFSDAPFSFSRHFNVANPRVFSTR